MPFTGVTVVSAGAQAGRLAVRTWWFDSRVAEALSGKFSPGALPRQVVLLGAGMDTRAWRELGFPAGTAIFACPHARGLVNRARQMDSPHAAGHAWLPSPPPATSIPIIGRPVAQPAHAAVENIALVSSSQHHQAIGGRIMINRMLI